MSAQDSQVVDLNEQEMQLNMHSSQPNNQLLPLQSSSGDHHINANVQHAMNREMKAKTSKKELMLREMQALHHELLELKGRSDLMQHSNEESLEKIDESKKYGEIENENKVLRAKLLEMESHLSNLSLSPESSIGQKVRNQTKATGAEETGTWGNHLSNMNGREQKSN